MYLKDYLSNDSLHIFPEDNIQSSAESILQSRLLQFLSPGLKILLIQGPRIVIRNGFWSPTGFRF